MDVSKVCRSCMREVTSWERENFSPGSVENMFSYCTNIKITDEDNLPRQFCYDCIIKIESAFTFITEAQKVNVTLKNIISRAITSIIVKPENSTNNTNAIKVNHTKLTLPDYKLSTTEDNHEPQILKQISNETDLKQAEEIKDTAQEQHDRQEEVSEKQFCPVCRKAFTSKTWLDKHIEKDHTRPMYSCSHCTKTFIKLSQLKIHSATHSDVRTHACGVPGCGKSFKRKKDLTNHTRRHDDFRPYVCDLCSMSCTMDCTGDTGIEVSCDMCHFYCPIIQTSVGPTLT